MSSTDEMKYPWRVPAAQKLDEAEEAGVRLCFSGALAEHARPALNPKEHLTGAWARGLGTLAALEGASAGVLYAGADSGLVAWGGVAAMVGSAWIALTAVFSALVTLTDEAETLWSELDTESRRALKHVKGTPEYRGMRYSLTRTAREVLDLLETASKEELYIRSELGIRSGTLTIFYDWQRNPYRHLQGELLAEVLEADARRVAALAAAEEAVNGVRDLADAAEDAAVARARYARIHGRGAPIREVDLTAVSQYAQVLRSDATAIAELPG